MRVRFTRGKPSCQKSTTVNPTPSFTTTFLQMVFRLFIHSLTRRFCASTFHYRVFSPNAKFCFLTKSQNFSPKNARFQCHFWVVLPVWCGVKPRGPTRWIIATFTCFDDVTQLIEQEFVVSSSVQALLHVAVEFVHHTLHICVLVLLDARHA